VIRVLYDRGIYLPDIDLWLDPQKRKETAFISHAHSDHIGNHDEVILTKSTAEFMAARVRGKRIEHTQPYRIPFEFRGATLTLLPAGHIFGSAQIHIRIGPDSLLYTGDFKLRIGRSAEPAEWMQADTLIMETTFGLPKYVFPPTDQIVDNLVKFCIESLEEGNTPILLGYSLGKAQEILESLRGSGLRILLHPAVYEMTALYKKLNDTAPEFSLYNESDLPGSVVICPPNTISFIQQIEKRRTAMFTGWAHDPSAIFRYQTDAVYPMSDHADYPDLIRYVELVQPQKVLSIHGYAHEFAADLRRRGYEAWSLIEDNQLELSLTTVTIPELHLPDEDQSVMEVESSAPVGYSPRTTDRGFPLFVSICDEIRKTTGKLNKTKVFVEYFRSLAVKDLAIVVNFLANYGPTKHERIAPAIIRRAIVQSSKLTEAEFRALSGRCAGDMSKVIFETMASKVDGSMLSIAEIADEIRDIRQTAGPHIKIRMLADLLQKLNGETAACLIQILTSTLHLGLKIGVVEEAVTEYLGKKLPNIPLISLTESPIDGLQNAGSAHKKNAIVNQMAFDF
jgi:DNA ligase-1